MGSIKWLVYMVLMEMQQRGGIVRVGHTIFVDAFEPNTGELITHSVVLTPEVLRELGVTL